MKNKNVILPIVGIFIIIGVTIFIMLNPFKKDIWNTNAENLKNSFNVISGDANIEDLTKFTPFKWDTLYSFAPYTPKEEIYKTIGYKWDNINETVSEGMNQIVFTNDGKVVCYLYGYPENIKLGFNFGKYDGSHIKLKSDEKLSFKTTITENGIRYLNYVKDDSAKSVVEKYFQYKNEKNKDKILKTLTQNWNAPNVIWGFENLDSIKILDIQEEKSDTIRNGYLHNGRGTVNGTTDKNLKVYKVKYEVKYKKDGIGPQDSGIYDWWYFVIRKDSNSPWLIDDFGV